MKSAYDFVVIGGGFYGCMLALLFKNKNNKVLIIEKEKDLLTKASYGNQARIHNGYHYPRSFLTAYRSHQNYLKFIKDFKAAVFGDFKQYYAIASNLSKTTAHQFFEFCKQIGSPIKQAPDNIKQLFASNLIDDVFEVDEIVFDAGKLREILKSKLDKLGIEVSYNTSLISVSAKNNNEVLLKLDNKNNILAKSVFNCTYSQINKILERSNFPLLPLKHEYIEMPLIKVPEELSNMSVTLFDGPFFGFLPFPDKTCYSLWHVRYAIRANWEDPLVKDITSELAKISKKSNWNLMKKDIQKYIPLLGKSEYLGSIFETKTVLTEKEEDDARPILFRRDWGIKNFNVVMGGKIDNIYDVIGKVKEEVLFPQNYCRER